MFERHEALKESHKGRAAVRVAVALVQACYYWGVGRTRTELRTMAEAMLADAILLFEQGRHSNAYYLAGYAVEFGLKACIASQITAETIPDKAILQKLLNHQFPVLVGLAGLAEALQEEQDRNPDFAANWAIVSEWQPDSRYELRDSISAQLLIGAIGDARSGVLRWIRAHW